MKTTGAFGFRFKSKDYLFRAKGMSTPADLGLKFLFFLNLYKDNKKIEDMVSGFVVKDNSINADSDTVFNVLNGIKAWEQQVAMEDKNNKDVAKDLVKLYDCIFYGYIRGELNKWSDITNFLYGDKNSFSGLMRFGLLSTDNLNTDVLYEWDNCGWAYIVNLDTKKFEIYRMDVESSIGRYSLESPDEFDGIGLVGEVPLQVIYDLSLRDIAMNMSVFKADMSVFKELSDIYNTKDKLELDLKNVVFIRPNYKV